MRLNFASTIQQAEDQANEELQAEAKKGVAAAETSAHADGKPSESAAGDADATAPGTHDAAALYL
jgi:hypothetical protein